MDMQNYSRNRFTLNTIAAAIVMFNSEVTSAASCPASIVGAGLAGIVCEFDIGTGPTVTITNGGTVGGIKMVSYSPASPSFIMVQTGGDINNTTGVGVAINSSTLSNGLINNGTINNTSGSSITINNANISGGLINRGLINSQNPNITINQSTISGGIFNNGTLTSDNGTGIRILFTSTINGGISNNGTISAGGVDSGIAIFNQSIVLGGITNNGLIEASGGNGILLRNSSTISGGISNSGTIQSTVNTGISVNIASLQGNLSNSGTIRGGMQGIAIHNASTVNGNITNQGLISGGNKGLSIFSSTTISGNISNSGTIRGNNTGLSIDFSSTINGSISNSGTIQGGIDAIFINPGSHVDNIDITGQHARIIGATNAPNTSFNLTAGTLFTSEGNFNINNFTIDANAVFHMANAITAQNMVVNAGTLTVGNQTQTINGNYQQNAGGFFQIQVADATHYGQLLVSNAVDLSQSGNINVQVSQNSMLHDGTLLPNVISGNTLISPSNGFNVTSNSFMWYFMPSVNFSSGVDLFAIVSPAAYRACLGNYCEGAAYQIFNEVGAGNPQFNRYVSLTTEKEYVTAASQATPELTNENIQVTQLVSKSIMDIVPMWSTLHGKSAGDAMIYQPGKLWIKPYGGSMNQDEQNTVDGFHASAYGVVMGNDIQLNEDGLVGGAIAVGGDNIHGKSVLSGQSIYSNTYEGMIYGAQKFPSHFYLAGQGLVGYGDNHTKRTIPLYISTAEASYDSWFTNLRAQFGWSTYFLNQNLVITPEIDASYLFVYQDSYQESGSPMDLAVESNNNSSLVIGAYGHAAYHFATLSNQQNLTLTGYVGASQDILNNQPVTTATFVAGGSSFTTFGVQFDELVFRGGVGLTLANPHKPLRMNLNYDLQSGNNAYSGVGTLTITYQI